MNVYFGNTEKNTFYFVFVYFLVVVVTHNFGDKKTHFTPLHEIYPSIKVTFKYIFENFNISASKCN